MTGVCRSTSIQNCRAQFIWDQPMSSTQAGCQSLTFNQVWLIISLALAFHIVPLLMADQLYLDDYWRTVLAENDWTSQGRPLTAALLAFLGFANGAPNIYPLPLLLALPIVGYSLARLGRHWYSTPSVAHVLVLLPLWYQPFFLQNLSYQFDGTGMALALVASILAITVTTEAIKYWFLGCLLVATAVAFYQVAVNVFIGLCCLDIMRQVMDGASFSSVRRQATQRLTQLIAGCLLYYAACSRMITVPRGSLLTFDGHWPELIIGRLSDVCADLRLLATPQTTLFMDALLVLASIALVTELACLWQRPCSRWEQLGLTVALLLPVPVIYVSITGVMLLFADYDHAARTLMGFGVACVLVLSLVQRALMRLPRIQIAILLIPSLFMLSIAFAYGRVQSMQKELNQALAHSIAQDLFSGNGLGSLDHYYLDGHWISQRWLPSAQGLFRTLPVLTHVQGVNGYAMLLPEMLTFAGVANVGPALGGSAPMSRQQVLDLSPTPVVERALYEIHRVDNTGYVLMKAPPANSAAPSHTHPGQRRE
ncbi:glucosyltransferase domain-containing protein [Pseudomonas sp. NPDC086566]|uniref:glucosyltransferase domain-containing protein n=1 Tax=Pseudomonas sp. NPDC086566 TaxID=3390647 RepID=UPI003D05D217